MIIQVIIILFVFFVLAKLTVRYQAEDITTREFVIWLVFWFLVVAATLMPHKTDVVAKWVGVGRGADLLTYVSVIVLFFIVFRILVWLEKIDKDITGIVRAIALLDRKNNSDVSQQVKNESKQSKDD